MKKALTKLAVGIFIDGDFVPSFSGAKNRMCYLSRYLCRSGIKVIIFHCYRGWSDLRLIAREPFKTYFFPVDRYYNDVTLLSKIIIEEGIQIIQFCDLESVISQGVNLSEETGAYLINELHYVVSRLARNLGETKKRVSSLRRLELENGRVVDHVIALTKEDSWELVSKMRLPSRRISVVPSGVDLDEIVYRGPNFEAKTVLFLGNLYFEPNADAVKLIYKYILPVVRRKGFRILLVGDCPPHLRKTFGNKNMIFTGTVLNLDDVFKNITVAIAPVRESSGLRIKILNYLAAGLPVISTPEAAVGMPSTKNIIIESDIKKFPDTIFKIADDQERATRIAKNGRRFIERNFNWRDIAHRTISVYMSVLSRTLRDKNTIQICHNSVEKPDWLEEFERKERFNKLHSKIRGEYSYGVVEKGKIKVFRP